MLLGVSVSVPVGVGVGGGVMLCVTVGVGGGVTVGLTDLLTERDAERESVKVGVTGGLLVKECVRLVTVTVGLIVSDCVLVRLRVGESESDGDLVRVTDGVGKVKDIEGLFVPGHVKVGKCDGEGVSVLMDLEME